MSRNYCLGFMFNHDPILRKVLLIHKKRPASLAGTFNGIGGQVFDNEDAFEAMVREFKEEAGIVYTDWEVIGAHYIYNGIDNIDHNILIFRAFSDLIYEAKTQTDEEIERVRISDLHEIPLSPFALEIIRLASNENVKDFEIQEEY